MSTRSIEMSARAPARRHGPGLSTTDLTADAFGDALDPFVMISLYEMTGPTFPPHPHAGFTVATYMLPESPVGFVNQDSLGGLNRIAPGAFHATIAGRGVLHEEQPERSGAPARGYQIWIDHADGDRELAPYALHLGADEVPVAAGDGATVRVVLGTFGPLASPLTLPTAVRLLDVTIEAGGRFAFALDRAETAFALVLDGDVGCGGRIVEAGWAVTFTHDGDEIALDAGAAGARLTLFAGRPFARPRVAAGPFVASDAGQARRFSASYQAGGFGELTPFAASPGRVASIAESGV